MIRPCGATTSQNGVTREVAHSSEPDCEPLVALSANCILTRMGLDKCHVTSYKRI